MLDCRDVRHPSLGTEDRLEDLVRNWVNQTAQVGIGSAGTAGKVFADGGVEARFSPAPDGRTEPWEFQGTGMYREFGPGIIGSRTREGYAEQLDAVPGEELMV